MKTELDQDDSGIMAEINMIPLIDVSLVLLIIFMVLTPVLVRSQINVNLPSAKASATTPNDSSQVDVEVQKDGTMRMDGKPATAEQIGQALSQRSKLETDLTVLVSADRDVVFNHVVRVMDEAKRAGVSRLGVAVNPSGSGSGR